MVEVVEKARLSDCHIGFFQNHFSLNTSCCDGHSLPKKIFSPLRKTVDATFL
jgi:hypothetical protein